MHSLISRLVPALPALSVDHNLSRSLASREIVAYGSALQLERAVNRMKNVTQREVHLRLDWIEREDGLLSE